MYNAEKLAERYDITKAALLRFVKSNLDIINKDGSHAFQDGRKKEWHFDQAAVNVLDKLRKINSVVVDEVEDNSRITELLEENSTLKSQLLVMQAKIVDVQEQLITVVTEKTPLLEAKAKAEVEAMAKDDIISKLKADMTEAELTFSALVEEKRLLEAQIATLTVERDGLNTLVKEQENRGFWRKFKDLWR